MMRARLSYEEATRYMKCTKPNCSAAAEWVEIVVTVEKCQLHESYCGQHKPKAPRVGHALWRTARRDL